MSEIDDLKARVSRLEQVVVQAYREMLMIESYYRDFELLAVDGSAQGRFVDLRGHKVRIPTMDLRIACVALVNNATLLTRNVRDFRQVPGLAFENWSR